MEVIALIGPSGTGKSHRATVVAHQIDAEAIIDDGLLILGNRILAGFSAKRQPTRIGAIRAALLMDKKHADEIKKALEETGVKRILILGTSLEMVKRIASRLGLPAPSKLITIEDVASEKEIRKARFLRSYYSKHVIPAPTLEVKRSFPGTLVDPLRVFLRKKGVQGKKDWLEQSVVRPTFTSHGKLSIANRALSAIISHAAHEVEGVARAGKVNVRDEGGGNVVVDIAPAFVYGCYIPDVAKNLQTVVKKVVEEMTGMQVKAVNINVKSLFFKNKKS